MNILINLSLFLAGTGLIKILLALSILRFGIGLRDWTSGILVLAVSVVLVLSSHQVAIDQAGGLSQWINRFNDTALTESTVKDYIESKKNLAQTTQPEVGQSQAETAQKAESFSKKLHNSVLEDLRMALKLGVMFILPFALIDILIAVTLGALGVTNLSVYALSFPVKLILFMLLDGWNLVFEKLIQI